MGRTNKFPIHTRPSLVLNNSLSIRLTIIIHQPKVIHLKPPPRKFQWTMTSEPYSLFISTAKNHIFRAITIVSIICTVFTDSHGLFFIVQMITWVRDGIVYTILRNAIIKKQIAKRGDAYVKMGLKKKFVYTNI